MGKLWNNLKYYLGFTAPGGSRQDAASQRIEDRILNADRYRFKNDEPETRPSNQK